MTPPVSGGLPEQGLRELLHDIALAHQRTLSGDPADWDEQDREVFRLVDLAQAALAGPRPMLPEHDFVPSGPISACGVCGEQFSAAQHPKRGVHASAALPAPEPPQHTTFADNGGLIGALQDIAYQARYDRSHALINEADPFEYYERIARTALAASACPALRPEHSPPVMGLYFYEVIGNACGWRIAKRVGTGSSVSVGQLDDGFSEASAEAVVNALNGRAALPAEHAPPDVSPEATRAFEAAYLATMGGPHRIDTVMYYAAVRDGLEAAYAVDCGARPALAGRGDDDPHGKAE